MSARPTFFTAARLAEARSVLARHSDVHAAAAEMSRTWKHPVSLSRLREVFRAAGLESPGAYLRRAEMGTAEPANAAHHPEIASIIELAKRHKNRGGLTLESVADALNVSPKRAREIVTLAQSQGYSIDVAHGEMSFRAPEPARDVADIAPATPGKDHAIAVLSDLHFGSKYCLGHSMQRFVERSYEEGIRDFFCPGDVLEGCYRHARWELSHASWEDQAEDFLSHLPCLPGARLVFIDGNHDWTWSESNGTESGRSLVNLAKSKGRTDIQFLGSRGALVKYGDTRIELWHPKKNIGYALSYQLQNHIRDTPPERLPDILLAGHWHQYIKFRRSNVWAFACPTFQHGDAPFGRSLGGDVAIGGLVLRWRKDDDGVVRHLSDVFHVVDHVAPTFDVEVA